MRVKAFPVDASFGEDKWHKRVPPIILPLVNDDREYMALTLGHAAIQVIDAMRKLGIDAREYDINLRIEP